jgi:Asp-tRNA(Asn)/Glu-tRNA(Gln) amidotransferase A subunit family amidase
MNAPFTGLGVPAISIPMPAPAGALPLGLQVTAARGQEALLLGTACLLSRQLQ